MQVPAEPGLPIRESGSEALTAYEVLCQLMCSDQSNLDKSGNTLKRSTIISAKEEDDTLRGAEGVPESPLVLQLSSPHTRTHSVEYVVEVPRLDEEVASVFKVSQRVGVALSIHHSPPFP